MTTSVTFTFNGHGPDADPSEAFEIVCAEMNKYKEAYEKSMAIAKKLADENVDLKQKNNSHSEKINTLSNRCNKIMDDLLQKISNLEKDKRELEKKNRDLERYN